MLPLIPLFYTRHGVRQKNVSRIDMGFIESTTITSRREFLASLDLKNKAVLDAGTGDWSARFLAEKNPKKIVCVSGPGDTRKKEEAERALQSTSYENYQLLNGNLADEKLFAANSFDLILADYLMEEIDTFAPLGICDVLGNFHRYLRLGGEVIIVNPEANIPFRPDFELNSALGIEGDAQLEKRDHRDLIDAVYLLLSTALTLKFMFPLAFNRYPSQWIGTWLINAGFKKLKRYFFDTQVHLSQEFTKRVTSVRQVIKAICAPKQREALLEQLAEIVSEFKHRNVPEDDFFLHRHYIIYAKKN